MYKQSFLQNIKMQYHIFLKVCEYFSHETFPKTQAITGSLVIEFVTLGYH